MTRNQIKVVTPKEGKWLYNEREKTISDKVYMPDGADVSVWQEITDAKKQELEAQWQAEIEAEMEVRGVEDEQ